MNKTIDKLYQNLDEKNLNNNFQFILFGGTGDLAHNKIFPAFYNLAEKNSLPDNYTIISTGRRYDNEKEYLEALYKSLEVKKEEIDNRVWQSLADKIKYFKLSFMEDEDFKDLRKYLNKKSRGITVSNRIFYLATAPSFFAKIARKLEEFDLLDTPQVEND